MLASALACGCKKSESVDTILEISFGSGTAKFIKVDSDLGIVACGVSDGKPYLVRLDDEMLVVTEISAEQNGIFTSVLFDDGYIIGGSSEGKMLIMRFNKMGDKLWEKSVETSFKVEQTLLLKIGDNNFLAIGSPEPDAVYAAANGIMFEVFDASGQELNKQEYKGGYFLACNDAAIDDLGYLYLTFTRKEEFAKPKASVAKFSSELNLLWEQELANNLKYGASALAVAYSEGNVFVGGKTELPKTGGGLIDNSFIACLSDAGDVKWKKYPENSNSVVSIAINSRDEINLLNTNCFVVNVLFASAGKDNRRISLYDVCEPATTDAFASDFDFDSNNNLVMAGAYEGKFYIAVKKQF